jgi:hypothetical protein
MSTMGKPRARVAESSQPAWSDADIAKLRDAHDIPQGYPLAEQLESALHRYSARPRRTTTVSSARESLDSVDSLSRHLITTLSRLTPSETALLGPSADAFRTHALTTLSLLSARARFGRSRVRKVGSRGAKPNIAALMLVRDLREILRAARPQVGDFSRDEQGELSGPFPRFVRDACRLMGVRMPSEHVLRSGVALVVERHTVNLGQ